MKKFILSICALFVFLVPFFANADQIGFPEDSLWYSKDELIVGDVVKIYTLILNGESVSLSGTVHFYDRDVLLGEKKITVEKNDAKVVSLDWKVTEGEHQFSARFSQATLLESDGKKISVVPSNPETKKDTVYVEKPVTQKADSTLNANVTSSDSSVDKNSLTADVSKATDYIKDKTPDNVEEKISDTTSTIENFRETWEENFKEKKEDEQLSLDALNEYYEDRLRAKEEADVDNYVKQTYVDSSGENILKKPLHYVSIFFYSLLAFVLGNALVFYGLGLLIVFLVLRTIYRSLRN
jgi:hypothetical protein